ncbi:MAG: signal peptidase II, partial [Gammaproteobacteria bacterium]|nr:signal peptidase II [Gammaproteobacteria bacterium]
VLIIDQATKLWIEGTMALNTAVFPIESLAPYLEFAHIANKGMAFGLFQGGSLIFLGIAIVMIGSILYFNYQTITDSVPFRLAMGLLLGGAIGNLIDRIRIGHVTDFIHINLLPLVGVEYADHVILRYLDWFVFNIADLAVVSGVIILLYVSLTEDELHYPTKFFW